MDSINPLDLKKRIDAKRKDFPFLSPYLGTWGCYDRAKIELARNPSPELASFIQGLEFYLSFGEHFLLEQGQNPDPQEAAFVIAFGVDAMKDPYCPKRAPLLGDLQLFYGDGEAFLPREKVALLYAIVTGYQKGNFTWRGKPYAKQLREEISKEKVPSEIYLGLSAFYKQVCDFAAASEVALTGAKLYLSDGDREEAAVLAIDGYVSAKNVPGFVLPSEGEIQALYEEQADKVLSYQNRPYIRHDEVEATKKFQDAYDEVMEKATERYYKEGAVHPFALWEYMEKGFAKKGIKWRNPKRMNPDMKFD